MLIHQNSVSFEKFHYQSTIASSMMSFTFVALTFVILGAAYCAPPEVPCPAPISPEHGQAFLYQEGHVVKYVCEPGYALKGREIVRCIDGKWEDPNPTCLEFGIDGIKEDSGKASSGPIVSPPPSRPLFSWGSDNEQAEINATSGEVPLSDEARVRLLMLPRRKIITEVRTAKIRSATEMEEEEKKRSKEGKADATTIHLESNPSVVYVRRTIYPSKSETTRKALRMTLENGEDVQLISVPTVDGRVYHSEETLRQLYWYAHRHPGKVALVEYRSGSPVVMTLTESQLAWINSLPSDLREQYLKDMYIMSGGDIVEPARVETVVTGDAQVYRVPTYPRRAVSLIMEDPIAAYDYSCHESGYPFVKAPSLRHMHVARYDKRQNPNNPYNHYLTAVYRCNPGYVMLDTRYTELHCSKKNWIGVTPVCIPRYYD